MSLSLMLIRFLELRRSRYLGSVLSLMVVCLLATGCNQAGRTAAQLSRDSKQLEEFDNSLTFSAVTLEEFDPKGRLWWRVKAKQAIYSKDKKIARVETPDGEFYQDGKAILKVKAQNGEVQQDGKQIFLRGQIEAIDTRDGTTFHGNEMEWQPQNDLLIVRNKMTGTQKKVQVSANEGKYFTRQRKVELQGQVVAISTDPDSQFKSEQLVWMLDQQTMSSDRPIQLDRMQNKIVTDRASSNKGTFNLKDKTALLQDSAQVVFASPPVQVNSNSLAWNLTEQTVTSDQPVSVVNSQQQTTLTANKGSLNLKTNQAALEGSVRGIDQQLNAQATAEQGAFDLTNRIVTLRQNAVVNLNNPPMQISGDSLVWNQSNRAIVADQPLTVINRQDQLTLSANQGALDQSSNLATMAGNVRGFSEKNQARINSDRLVYNLVSKQFEADGNVVYQQVSPTLNLNGPRAYGTLQDQNVTVSGGRVTTEFTPQ